MKKLIFIFLSILWPALASPSAAAENKVLFEGYYRIEVKGVHRGYVVQRHEYNQATQERTLTYFMWRKEDGDVSQMGVKAVSRNGLRPKSYSLYEWLNADSTVLHGKFGPKNLELTKHDLRTNKVIEVPEPVVIPQNAIFSSYVTQVMAKADPEAYREGLHMSFVGFSEESAEFDDGLLKILRTNPFENQMVYQVLASFMNEDIELFTFRNGEMLGSRSEILDNVTYLVGTKEEAIGDFKIAADSLKKVFGNIPHGATNNPVGQAKGKLQAKEVIKSFPKSKDSDRQPNSKELPKAFQWPAGI